MKVCIVTARIPPVRCGVGDYTVQVADTLAARGDEVVVVTARDQAPVVPGARFGVRNVIPGWGVGAMPQLWRALKSERPDVVLLQWVPFLYSRTGTNLVFPLTLALLALSGIRLRVMVHEPWVPFTRWSFFITGPIQRVALGILVTVSEDTGVSIERWVRLLRRRFWWRRRSIHWVPVGSNIPVEPPGAARVRAAAGIPSTAPVVGVFSLSGSAKAFALITAAWQRLAARDGEPYIVLIGATADEAREYLPAIATHPRCRTTGYLPPADVSHWLSAIDLLLAPFLDGVSSRRGSVMAALDHGVPVVTTRGSHSDALFLNSPLALSEVDDESFAEAASSMFEEMVRGTTAGDASKRFYDRHFAWPLIAEQILPRPVARGAFDVTGTQEPAADHFSTRT